MTFEKGQSGNPARRPQGSRNKATILAEAMFQGIAPRPPKLAACSFPAINKLTSLGCTPLVRHGNKELVAVGGSCVERGMVGPRSGTFLAHFGLIVSRP